MRCRFLAAGGETVVPWPTSELTVSNACSTSHCLANQACGPRFINPIFPDD